MTRALAAVAATLCLSLALPAFAQQPARPAAPANRAPVSAAQTGRLIVTVVDQTNSVLPTATVTVEGIDDATKQKTLLPVTASDQGVAAIADLALGRYSVKAEFPGFETNIVKDTRVRAGDNKVTVTLALSRMTDSVTVGQDAAQDAVDPHGSSFGTALTNDQLDALSDDPDTLQQQLNDLAGPGATIRVDSFEGGQLPPKSQIKSIHVTRDAFAAENHNPNNFFVDIITQPGVGPLRGGFNSRVRNSSMSGVNQITNTVQPERAADVGAYLGGSLIHDRASFSLQLNGTNQFIKPVSTLGLVGGEQSSIIGAKQQTNRFSAYGELDYAITKDQTLRLNYQQFSSTNDNLGIGQYDQPERAYSSNSNNYQFRIQEAGPLGRRFFTNTRLNVAVTNSDAHSATEAQTIVVNDEFSSGGAQQAGGRDGKAFTFASDLDYVHGIHSVRGGVLLDGGWYSSNAETNYLGTYTFASLADYQAGSPLNYTQRIGDPTVKYFTMQSGLYLQDDIRVRKNLTLSAGARWEAQTHLKDNNAIGPRVGLTWSPFKSGHTTLRGSAGIFYDWLIPDTYEQTLRVDGYHQLQVNVSRLEDANGNITQAVPYPNPASLSTAVSDRYLLSPGLHFQHYRRLSSGIDQTMGAKLRVSETYSYVLGDSLWRGENLNAPVNGIRPDPAFGNVIEVVGDAGSHQHQLTTSVQANLAGLNTPQNPFSQSGPFWNAKRLSINASYTLGKFTNNTDGRFAVPPTGDINLEWGPASGDIRNRVNVNVSSTQIKNLNASVSVNASSGSPYSIRTGGDDNGDGLFTDRPLGVPRDSERTAGQFTTNAYLGYTFVFGRATGPGGVGVNFGPGGSAPVVTQFAAPPKYRLQVWIQALNVTNHANYVGYSGTEGATFFLQPTNVANPRKFDIGINLNF